MKKVLSSLLILSLIASSMCVSFASNYEETSKAAEERVLVHNTQITDNEALLERAQNNISDTEGDSFKVDSLKGVEVISSYHTTQLLEEKVVDGGVVSEYAATSILEIEPLPTTSSPAIQPEGIQTILAGPRESKVLNTQILAAKSIGDGHDTANGHVYLYCTIYYTKSTETDVAGDVVDVATFTKATVSLDLNESVTISSGSYTLKETGYLTSSRQLKVKSKPFNISSASSDVTYGPSTTGFPSMYNIDILSSPFYSITTVLNWRRGTTSGTSSIIYEYEVGGVDSWE